jgi:hypothetical protein
MVLYLGSGNLVGRMEILCVDVPGAGISRSQHAELAQIHRARWTDWLDGEQLDPEHYF